MLALALMLTVTVAAPASPETPAERFQRGRRLIEANCGECMGATREGLERGIQDVREALEMGYPGKKEAYRRLAEGNNTLALVFLTPDSREQHAVLGEVRKAYETLLELDPKDAGVRYEYAATLPGLDEQLVQYRKVLELKPDHADARFAVAMILLERERKDEGLQELRKAFEQAVGGAAETYGIKLQRLLLQEGRKKEAEEVRKQLQEKLKEKP